MGTARRARGAGALVGPLQCDLVQPGRSYRGVFELTSGGIAFTESREAGSGDLAPSSVAAASVERSTATERRYRDRAWPLDAIQQVYLRRFRMRRSALEVFFTDHTTAFVSFREIGRAHV